MTILFGDILSLKDIIKIIVLSSIIGELTAQICSRCFRSNSKLRIFVGSFLVLGMNSFALYMFVEVMMSKMTIDLSNQCSATYAIFIIWDYLFFKTILVYLKYLIELSKSN